MTIEQLEKVHKAQPFRPFALHLADGRELVVRHPEMMARTKGGRTLLVGLEGEDFEIVDLLLVTSLEVAEGKAKSARR